PSSCDSRHVAPRDLPPYPTRRSSDLLATLPEAGAQDGLRRMYRTPAERNLRAKTGTIDRVSALSGYVRSADGERLAFSIISNDVDRKSTRLNSSHVKISYAVSCLKKK